MTSPILANTSHPRPEFDVILQYGTKVLNLALAQQALLDPRLPPGTIAGLSDDLEAIGDVVPGAKQAREESQTATVEEHAATRKGYARVTAVRKLVRDAGAPPEVRRAYTVGQKVDPRLASDVTSAIQQILARAKANPAEAVSLGIVQKDLDGLKTALQALQDAGEDHTKKRAGVPLTTQERNRTANRILKAGARIVAAGILEFADAPLTLAAFQALHPPKKPKSKKAAKAANGSAPANGSPAPTGPVASADPAPAAPASTPASTNPAPSASPAPKTP